MERYPTLEEKACALAYTIIRSHVFSDANKRTGAEALFLMLEMNGKTLLATDDEIVEKMEAIARNEMTLKDFVAWVRRYSPSR